LIIFSSISQNLGLGMPLKEVAAGNKRNRNFFIKLWFIFFIVYRYGLALNSSSKSYQSNVPCGSAPRATQFGFAVSWAQQTEKL
jgi:hypothetical protein